MLSDICTYSIYILLRLLCVPEAADDPASGFLVLLIEEAVPDRPGIIVVVVVVINCPFVASIKPAKYNHQ